MNFIVFIFLYSRFLLVIYFIHISVYMSIPISQFIPPLPLCTFFIEVKCTHTKIIINYFKVYNQAACSTFRMLCHHHLCLVSRHFPHQGNPIPIKQSLRIPTFPQTLAITNLLFVSMDLPIFHVSNKWSHTIYVSGFIH